MTETAICPPLTPESAPAPLREIVGQVMEVYFSTLDGQPAQKLYDLVVKEVELGLLKTVLAKAGGNQSKAAQWLGLARGTLRKKLSELGLE
jgi:Fis family transcriptional regulator